LSARASLALQGCFLSKICRKILQTPISSTSDCVVSLSKCHLKTTIYTANVKFGIVYALRINEIAAAINTPYFPLPLGSE
ncbi:MAG: hypothetical protein Q7R66_21595, partial [Undibacterium sp.]|uniref:hypothetical protein n=1 Tax=Undibacterium sp. TaxID=1914977 RepID=UPI0027187247